MAKECKFVVNYTRMSCVSTLKCTGFEWQTSNAASSASVIQLEKKTYIYQLDIPIEFRK